MKQIIEIITISILIIISSCNASKDAIPCVSTESIESMSMRLLPDRYDDFIFEKVESINGSDFFEVQSSGKKILIKGNTGVAMATGFKWYLEEHCNSSISLNYNRLDLPKKLPKLSTPFRLESPFEYRYIFNYCTYGYTMPWWDWDRWEDMIDYMALMGVNMPLATIGQEAVWQEVYLDMGLSQQQVDDFFVGPAHLPWGWMGNIDSIGGPLPQNWIRDRADLQKKILGRMRSLGMKPILQGFTGHVPESLKDIYPTADIVQIDDWAGIPGTNFLSPTDSLFKVIGNKFINKQTEMFGTDHLYDADCFIEVNPPSKDPEFLRQVSKTVYESMAEADPEAIWVIQGWFFFFKKDFWQEEQGEAFLAGIPKGKTILIDLYGEKNPTWKDTKGFFGQNWIWDVICNEDQKVNMSGDLQQMQDNFMEAYTSEYKDQLKGIGVIPEGLGYNPIVQEFIFKKAWHTKNVDLDEWVEDYAKRRYGTDNQDALLAWKYLHESVYSRTRTIWSPLNTTPRLRNFSGGKEDIRHVRGQFTITDEDPYAWDFDVDKLAKAASLLYSSHTELASVESWRFDMVNVFRELLHALTHQVINDLTQAFLASDQDAFDKAGDRILKLFDDWDEITGANQNFLLGEWLEDAKSWGKTPEEKAFYNWNARTIVTIWQPWVMGGLRDYAGKQWNGLLKDYYKPRWSLFIDELKVSLNNPDEYIQRDFELKLRQMDFDWTYENQLYSPEAKGDIVKIAERIFEDYKGDFKF